MKVLVAARRLATDVTSEGICSAKYVAALVAQGHSVRCLTADPLPSAQALWHATNAPVSGLADDGRKARGTWTRWLEPMGRRGGLAGYSARKCNGLSARCTGYSLTTWEHVARWRRTIDAAIASWHPDVVVIRGAGREFEPHLAMLGWQPGVPWVAHYHDPYPHSLYPEPYRQRVALQSAHQERAHRHIVAAADALTFPSRRLLEWVLRDELHGARRKAFVVPHIAGGWSLDDSSTPASSPSSGLRLVHAGTLLRERDPRPLLNALLRFIGDDSIRRAALRLEFLGRIDAAHPQSPEWQALVARGVLTCRNTRVSYRSALGAAQAATALVILEADAVESPFFPAKLADCLAAGRPIVAITPDASVTSDILGRDYPLRAAPGDADRLLAAIEQLWTAWLRRDLRPLLPPPQATAPLQESAVGKAAGAVFDHLIDARRGRAA